jgi:hypothetical protein
MVFWSLQVGLVDEIETEGSRSWEAKDSQEKVIIPIMAAVIRRG